MSRHFVPFGSLWNMKIEVPYSFLVKDGALAWSCGQLAMDKDGEVVSPHDPLAQSKRVARYIETIVRQAGMEPNDIVRLALYHRANCRAEDFAPLRDAFAPGVLIDLIPVPYFYYEGVELEVDVFCHQGAAASVDSYGIKRLDADGLTYISVEGGVETLTHSGFDPHNVLTEHWFNLDDRFSVRTEDQCRRGILVLAPDVQPMAREDDGVEFTSRVSDKLTWVRAFIDAPEVDLVRQTTLIMNTLDRQLTDMNASFHDVVKSTTFYVADASPEALHSNMTIRNGYYTTPGPASTGVPVLALSRPGAKISVDLLLLR